MMEQNRVDEARAKLEELAVRMTLRDYFAGQALTGLLFHRVGSREDICSRAYMVADAMIRARKI